MKLTDIIRIRQFTIYLLTPIWCVLFILRTVNPCFLETMDIFIGGRVLKNGNRGITSQKVAIFLDCNILM